ncbi:MAG: hypothetical protein ABIO70_16905 [Pseudomonadota bacterium]
MTYLDNWLAHLNVPTWSDEDPDPGGILFVHERPLLVHQHAAYLEQIDAEGAG